MTKKFKVTIEKEFEVPANATDQEYDDMKAVVLAGIKDDEKTKVKDKTLTPFGFNGAWRFWKVVKELTPEEFKPVYERIRKVPNAIKALKIATIIGLDSAQRCLWDEFVKNNLQS